jgi:hypothetical protein
MTTTGVGQQLATYPYLPDVRPALMLIVEGAGSLMGEATLKGQGTLLSWLTVQPFGGMFVHTTPVPGAALKSWQMFEGDVGMSDPFRRINLGSPTAGNSFLKSGP